VTVYDERGVPILFRGAGVPIGLSEPQYKVAEKHRAAALGSIESDDEDEQPELLIGHVVAIDNRDPNREAPFTPIVIGGSDFDQALKECIGGFDVSHIGDPGVSSDAEHTPQWVASTHEGLATALADYYSCKVIPITEVV
jgi:hypothetical protein